MQLWHKLQIWMSNVTWNQIFSMKISFGANENDSKRAWTPEVGIESEFVGLSQLETVGPKSSSLDLQWITWVIKGEILKNTTFATCFEKDHLKKFAVHTTF